MHSYFTLAAMINTLRLLFTIIYLLESNCFYDIKFRVTAHTTPPGGTVILYATNNDIRLVNTVKVGKTYNTSVIVRDLKDGTAVDFYNDGQLICWSDREMEMIGCVSYNETFTGSKITIVKNGLLSPNGLAIDWYTKKIYWTDSETHRIEVATLDGKNRKVLFWSDIDQPRAIAVVPSKGLLFWSDWGDIQKIERAGMDGDPKSRQVIVKDDIFWPNGLTIDYAAEKIYWLDAKLKFIDVIDYDGQNRKRIVETGLVYAFAITLHNNILYWTDWKTWYVYTWNITTSGPIKELIRPDLVPMDIRVWSPQRQPPPAAPYPCTVHNAQCSHLCLLSAQSPGYTCACPTGVRLLANSTTTCEDGPRSFLIVVLRTGISRISLDSPDYTPYMIPLKGIKHTVSVDYDPVEEYIYWTDDEARRISRAHIDGTSQSVVIQGELGNPDGLAVDCLAGNLYWTDPYSDTISVARLNGSSRKVVINNELYEPRAIALAPVRGWMFWSDWHEKRPKIERASLDGTERVVLVSVDLGWPNGIALDVPNDKIYWGDARTDKLEVCNMDGSGRREVLSDNLHHIFGMTLLGDFVYWTDWQRRTLDRVNKLTGTERESIVEQLANMMGLKAFRIGDEVGWNPCVQNNGNCTHLCFNTPSRVVCDCPLGLELAKDKRSCVQPAAFLLYACKDKIGRISIENQNNDAVLPISHIKDLSSFGIHISEAKLYWSDSKQRSILRCDVNGSNVEKIIDSTGLVEGLAIDWAGQNVYWTDSMAQRIEVARLDGSSRRALIWQGLKKPKSIVLDPRRGYMYWTEWGSKSIKRSGMEGSSPHTILELINRANALTIDYEKRALLWITLDPAIIETSDLDGANRRKLITEKINMPMALAVYQDYLYWGDWSTGEVEYALKSDGSKRVRLQTKVEYIGELAVYHRSRQPGVTQCSSDNGGCSHLCLAVPAAPPLTAPHFSCACPTHYRLDTDNVTCQAPTEYLLFAQRNAVGRLMTGTGDCPDASLPLAGLRNVKAVEYDPVKGQLYWMDGRAGAIRRMGASTPAVTVVSELAKPFDLALDAVGRVLYWSCVDADSINVTALHNETAAAGTNVGPAIIVAGEGMLPRHLAFHQNKRLLFWNDIGIGGIMRAAADGSLRTQLAAVSNATALALDPVADVLYWAVARQIHAVDIHGKNRRVVWQGGVASSLAAYGGALYWADSERQLMRLSLARRDAPANPVAHVPHVADVLAVHTVDRTHPCFGGAACGGAAGACLAGGACGCGAGCAHGSPPCGPLQFTCASSRAPHAPPDCVPLSWRCDGQSDCPDESDEQSCGVCGARVRCADGRCADSLATCEAGALCGDDCCGAVDAFRCPGTRLCLASRLLCDARSHCADGADEVHTACPRVDPPVVPNSNVHIIASVMGATVIVLLLGWVAVRRLRTSAARRRARVAEAAVCPDMRMYPCKISVAGTERGRATGASSSLTDGSSCRYPRESLNPAPPPSPATTAPATSQRRPRRAYRHYRAMNRPPPPTPCSTDACESDCAAAPPPSPAPSSPSSPSSRSSAYFSPFPPPPSPVPHFFDS